MTTFMTKNMALASTMIAFLVMGIFRYSMFISGVDKIIFPWISMMIAGVFIVFFLSIQLSRELTRQNNKGKMSLLYMQLIGMTAVATLAYIAIEYSGFNPYNPTGF